MARTTDTTRPLAIRAANAFDGDRARPDGALVLCRDGRIVGVEPASAAAPDGWEVHDAGDATVLPGLIDTHVHLGGDGRTGALDRLPDFTDEQLDAVIDTALRDHLRAGVTTVRDLGDRRWSVVDRRGHRPVDPTAAAPTIVASGPPITTRRGHCWAMGGEAETDEELRAAVRERAERGVDVVKIMASGGAMTANTDLLAGQYPLRQLRLVVDEAHAAGLPVTAHAHGLASVELALAAGVDGIEHCSCFTEQGIQLSDDLVARLAASGVVVCPTMGVRRGVTLPPGVIAMQQRTGTTYARRIELAGRLCTGGVDVVSGVDGGVSDGKVHGMIALAVADLVTGGADPAFAVATATSRAARACGLGGCKGSLRAGYDADLVVVDGDPVADITALERVRSVFVRGVEQVGVGSALDPGSRRG